MTHDYEDDFAADLIREMFEELVREGTWERVGDAYQPTAKGEALHDLERAEGFEPKAGKDYGNA